jgi:hypothetical protein
MRCQGRRSQARSPLGRLLPLHSPMGVPDRVEFARQPDRGSTAGELVPALTPPTTEALVLAGFAALSAVVRPPPRAPAAPGAGGGGGGGGANPGARWRPQEKNKTHLHFIKTATENYRKHGIK